MRGGQDGHVGPEHDTFPNGDEPVLEDDEVKVSVEPVAQADDAPVVDEEGQL